MQGRAIERRLAALEGRAGGGQIAVARAGRCDWSLEDQAQACRNLLAACARGDVERTPDGYRAITDNSGWQQPFEIEPGRWEKRAKILPECAEINLGIAEVLTSLFKRTGKYFPVLEGLALLPNPEFVAAVYRHYGTRIFDE